MSPPGERLRVRPVKSVRDARHGSPAGLGPDEYSSLILTMDLRGDTV